MKPEEFDEVVDFCDLVFAGNGNGEPYVPARVPQRQASFASQIS
jgi:hypothetical protein